jgi:hypothetical protein
LFKIKKFRARSGFKNPTHRIEAIRVQTTYAERKNSVIGKQDNDKDTLPTNNTIITKYLTEECKDCTGFYRNKFIAHVFLCRCACHKKSKIANSEPGHYSYDPEVEHSTVGVQKNAA